mgnify:CR=1 FL=1
MPREIRPCLRGSPVCYLTDALDDLQTIPDKVFEQDIIHPGGYFILEHGDEHSFTGHPLFVKEKHYGRVHFSFFEKQ